MNGGGHLARVIVATAVTCSVWSCGASEGAGQSDRNPGVPPSHAESAPVTTAESVQVPGAVDPLALDPEVRARLESRAAGVRQSPHDAAAWLALADDLLAHGEASGAAAAYAGATERLPRDDPRFERATYLRAVSLNDAGETLAALEAISPIVQSSRASQVHWRAALLLAGDGRLEDAMAAARAAVAVDPRDMRAHAALAQIASESADWPAAEKAARDGLRLNPRNGHLYGILAASLRAQGRGEEATPLAGAGRFTRADWLDPWLAELRTHRLGQAAASERFYDALRSGNADLARAELEAFAGHADATSGGKLALMRAQLALSVGDLGNAASQIARAESDGAAECDVVVVRAAIAARQAASPAALDPIVATLLPLHCDGDREASRLELVGNARLAQQRWADAAQALADADAARPGGVGPSLKKAITTMQKAGATTEALALAARLRAVEPFNPDAQLLFALLSLRTGDIAAARAAATELARLAPDHPGLPRLLAELQRAPASP